MVTNSFKKMEDTLVDFVMTGKLAFKDLANSIIRDMIRIAIQQTIMAPFTNWFGSLFSGGNTFSGLFEGVGQATFANRDQVVAGAQDRLASFAEFGGQAAGTQFKEEQAKKAIEEAILDGKIDNDHDNALTYLYQIKDDYIS